MGFLDFLKSKFSSASVKQYDRRAIEKLVDEKNTPRRRYDRNNQQYFWRKNMVLVNDFKSETIEQIIYEMMDEGDFVQAFEKINMINLQ